MYVCIITIIIIIIIIIKNIKFYVSQLSIALTSNILKPVPTT